MKPISLALGLSLTASSLTAQSDPQVTKRLDSALTALEAKGFNGVVRIDRAGATLLEKGYGLANRAEHVAFSPRTVVQIGSNTKDFTIVALLQLHERGKLGIRDSLAKFFPAAPADKRDITLWQLVNHTAGFPIGLGGDFDQVTRQEFIERAMARPLLFAPGKGEQYSNTGFAVLAAVIEQVSGQSYDEYVRDHILAPLGMKNTGLLLPHFDPKRLSHGYRNGADMGDMLSKPHATDGPYWNLRGNGGMLSTVDDMATFYHALLETNTLLKPETRALRFNPSEPLGLAGSDLVNFFLYDRFPRARTEILIATNSAEFGAQPVRAAIGAVLGLPSPDGGPGPTRALAGGAPRANATAPAPAVATTIRSFVAALNAGDSTRLTRFIADHFAIEPGTPDATARGRRWLEAHGNLGTIEIKGLDQIEPSVVELSGLSSDKGALTLRFQLAPGGKIQGIQVLIGG
jgi:CubicO group peptidase (beta-lactamase class C family)